MSSVTISIGSDHAGFELKEYIKLKRPDLKWNDLGTHTTDSVDYPDFADLVAKDVLKTPGSFGVLVCGSGQGVCMRANRYPKIRAALVFNIESAKMSRQHNDANVICMGARFIDKESALECLNTFLKTEFEGGRHARRVDKLTTPVK